MAPTLLGNAHTRASSAALTGQPWCVSIPVVGAFIAGAVPTNSRDANEPPPMAFACRSKTVSQRGHCVCSITSHAPALSSHHLLTCRNEGMLGRRHDDLRRTLRDMATTAGPIAEEEPRGLPGFGQGGWGPSHPCPPPWTVHRRGCVRRLGACRRTGRDRRQPRRGTQRR